MAQRGSNASHHFKSDMERQHFLVCQKFGLPWPPDPMGLYTFIQIHKHEGQRALTCNQLDAALNHYSVALEAVSVLPQCTQIQDEFPKLQCNLSLIFTKLGLYDQAEAAAVASINTRPSFVKGYWRAACAVKTCIDGISRALFYILQGLCRSMEGDGTQEDVVYFLTELCTLIPLTKMKDLEVVGCVDEFPYIDDQFIWRKVLTQLSQNNQWDSVAMLVTGEHNGKMEDYEGIVKDQEVSCAGVSVGALLSSKLGINMMKPSVVRLAVELLKLGASADEIGVHAKQPPINLGVITAVQSGSVELLKHLLGVYRYLPEKRDAQDEFGLSPYHCLIITGQAHTTLGETILRLLINHDCNPSLRDKKGKLAIELVPTTSTAFSLLINAIQSTDRVEKLKEEGNAAKKDGRLQDALRMYSEAISIMQGFMKSKKEAAILYTNRANVLISLGRLREGLADARQAIICNPAWQKGHWWKGKSLRELGQMADAFRAFMDGYEKTQSLDLVVGASSTIYMLTGRQLLESYQRLLLVDRGLWPQVLERLAKTGDWRGIGYLLLGPNCEKMVPKANSDTQDIEVGRLCVGAAGHISTKEIKLYSIFDFIRQEEQEARSVMASGHWLNLTLLAVLCGPNSPSLESLCENNGDTPLHAATRFALHTGRCTLLKQFPGAPDGLSSLDVVNGNGDTVYHTITKFRPLPEVSLMMKLTTLLQKKGINMLIRDCHGRLPVEYLDRYYPGAIFDLFFKATKQYKVSDINKLKEQGNVLYKAGQIKEAVEKYTQAIGVFHRSSAQSAHAELTNHDIAVLYGNRAEGYMKLNQFEKALDDAKECVAYDGHWYKGHFKVGKALHGLLQLEGAMRAFINAFKDVRQNTSNEDTTKVEILVELAHVCSAIPGRMINCRARLPNFPHHQGHLWARAALELIVKNSWDIAQFCYWQFEFDHAQPFKFVRSLGPLCDLPKLKVNNWGMNLIAYFLDCGSDRHTIHLDEGDTYFHAVVRLTLIVGKNMSLLDMTLKKFVVPNKQQNMVDHRGNTVLHVATKEKGVPVNMRYEVILKLLNSSVDPSLYNKNGKLAIDFLSRLETKTHEILRMKMFTAASSVPDKRSEVKQPSQTQVKGQEVKGQDQPPKVPSKKGTKSSQCDPCEELLKEGTSLLEDDDMPAAFEKFTTLIQEKHRGSRHESLLQKALSAITTGLGKNVKSEIPHCLTKLRKEFIFMLLHRLATANSWHQLDSLIRKCRAHSKSDNLKGFARDLSVVPVVSDKVLSNEEELKRKIVTDLLNNGATMGTDGGGSAVSLAVAAKHFRVVHVLIERGADHTALTMYKGDTPLHAAVVIALDREKGNSGILEMFLDLYEKDPAKYPELNPERLDSKGDCLYHLLAKAKYSNTTLKLTEQLCKRKISANFYNKVRNYPLFYIKKKNDRRLQFLRLASSAMPKTPQDPDLQEEEADHVEDDDFRPFSRSDEVNSVSQHDIIEISKAVSQREIRKLKIENIVRLLPDSSSSVFRTDHSPTKQKPQITAIKPKSLVEKTNLEAGVSSQGPITCEVTSPVATVSVDESNTKSTLKTDQVNNTAMAYCKQQTAVTETDAVETDETEKTEKDEPEPDLVIDDSDDENDDDEEEEEEEFVIDAQVFDNMEWEVECTADVWKTLRDKHVPTELKRRIVHKIQLLASGDWQPVLRKPLHHVPPNLKLYEAKFSKGSRIMWELAIAFSPRCSESAERRLQQEGDVTHPVAGGRIYSEIIRVWDIVLDHKKINRSVQRIIKSHQRGEECIIQKNLKQMKQDTGQLGICSGKVFPKFYAENDVPLNTLQEMQQFFPPASANETEYHILKFYSFSSALVSHVLQNIETKVDFPFRVTDLEHAIINLQSRAPILLLGRSGTGKTTCCLYRLWSQFHSYWSKAKEADSPLLPRCVEFVFHDNSDHDTDEEEDGEDAGGETEDEMEENSETLPDRDSEDEKEQLYDHLHQIFITKNAVLCSEVQKNFRELRHADNLMTDHVVREEENLPARLQDVEDLSYPLFLTSRQLLLTLDASIGPPYFFERKDDGSLKVDIQGWTDGDGPLNILPLLEEDSDEEDGDETQTVHGDDSDNEDYMETVHTKSKKVKVDPRREISYEVFVEEVWPRIKKNMKVSYHPSLIWVEIMSFIKGSYEALSRPCGYLQKEEYFKLGRKRAPNFTGARDKVYEFFLRYEHFKTQHSLFDETDLVHNMFRRLREMDGRPWVIHQIFVDETQDFTQAELCLLIRLCQNPNSMFLTGDTAQSIMRGISFRFSDLRSLFYHAQKSMQAMGKTSAVAVPKQVYQLTHNYRSHAGILSLASAVLDLMVEFFPESFDRLKKDQGLFHGPQPILLESCSFGDLAVLLRGNRRKTSHIEFGAHQAILVVNDAARDSIPEELRLGLVLTIYEAKGLEFDDVLIYNFFKDSQASKEWRVVTDYLERLANQDSGATEAPVSLVELDAAVLKAENRPRPLTFDVNLHKVLNSELKHLYTALTRARVNVWIFDEDMGKRAPMFEYFKARKLVKSLEVSDINETGLSEAMFAEKSSQADWIKRGEDFMRNSLYQVAAKCFGMGGEELKQKVALSHWQALKASRLKDHPRQMREEFLHAAEMYLECSKPAKAAVCLLNARERELAAQLFEKLGQYDKAADIYRKIKRPLASSRCYEQLGQFNQAVEVLYQNESYDMAIDTLKRYKMMVKDFEMKQSPALTTLQLYKPSNDYTEDRLSYRAAELYHRYKNLERMLESLERLPRVDDRVEFLKKKGYISNAADILEQNGRKEDAARLLMIHGKIGEGVAVARRTLNEEVIANCLLIEACVLLHKGKPHEIVLPILTEASALFESVNSVEGFGKVALYHAEITRDQNTVKKCWKAFCNAQPFQNEAGLMECASLLIAFGWLDNITVCKNVVRGIEYLFNVLEVLLQPNTPEKKTKLIQYITFYGLISTDATASTLIVYPKQKPRCLEVLKELQTKSAWKHIEVRVPSVDAREKIAGSLLTRAHEWLHPIWNALLNLRQTYLPCPYYQSGEECPHVGDVDNPCRMLHQEQDIGILRKLIEVDASLIECEYNIQHGASRLKRMCPPAFRKSLAYFTDFGETPDSVWKYQSCVLLLGDVLPEHKIPAVLASVACNMFRDLGDNIKIWEHMRNYVKALWERDRDVGDKKKLMKTNIVRNTDTFLVMIFTTRLFQLDRGRKRIEPSLEVAKLEKELTDEIRKEDKKEKDYRKTLYYYTLMGDKQPDQPWVIQCVARRFMEAYELLSRSNPDPYEAIFTYSKFIILLTVKRNYSYLPRGSHLLYWQELFTSLSFMVIAKMKVHIFSEFVFVVPASYLSTIKFLEASLPKEAFFIEEQVHRWKPWKYQNAEKIGERLKYMINMLCGISSEIHLIRDCVSFDRTVGNSFAVAERILILGLTLVCNVGKSVPVDCEVRLMKSLCSVQCPTETPERLRILLKSIQAAKGLADIATALITLLKKRNEECFVCQWSDKSKSHLQKMPLHDVVLFSKTFLHEKTMEYMNQPLDDLDLEAEDLEEGVVQLTMEEIQRGRRDQEARVVKEQQNRAAIIITRFIRRLAKQQQQKKMAQCKHSEQWDIFITVQVDDLMCGVCGTSFNGKLQEQLERERLTASQAELGEETATMQFANVTLTPGVSPNTKRPYFNRMVSHDFSGTGPTSQVWSASHREPTTRNNKELLKKIREDHEQSQGHIQKNQDFLIFRKAYEEQISKKLKVVKELLFDNKVGLLDSHKQNTIYAKIDLDITRMNHSCLALEFEIKQAVNKKTWDSMQQIHQISQEMMGYYHQVEPHVQEVQRRLAQEENERASQTVSASSSNVALEDEYGDEADDIEDVVAAPRFNTREFRRTRQGQRKHGRKSGYRGYRN